MFTQTVAVGLRTIQVFPATFAFPHGEFLQVGYKDFGLLSRILQAALLSSSLLL